MRTQSFVVRCLRNNIVVIITIFFIPSGNDRKPDGCGYRVIVPGQEKPRSVASDDERLYARETVMGAEGDAGHRFDLCNRLRPLKFGAAAVLPRKSHPTNSGCTCVYTYIHLATCTYTLLYTTYNVPRRPSSMRRLPKGVFALRQVVTKRYSLYTLCDGWEWREKRQRTYFRPVATTLPFVRGELRYTDLNRKHAKMRYAHGSDTNRGGPTCFLGRRKQGENEYVNSKDKY